MINNKYERSKIEKLPAYLRKELDDKLIEKAFGNYMEIEKWLRQRMEEEGIDYIDPPSHAMIHRYGTKLKNRLDDIRVAASASKYLEGYFKEEDDLNPVIIKLTQVRLFELLFREDLTPREIMMLARAISDVTKGSYYQAKHKQALEEKLSDVSVEIEAYRRVRGLTKEVAEEIRKQILGIQ